MNLFLIAELVWLFFCHVTHANDSGDDVSDAETKKHESVDVTAVPANARFYQLFR